MTVGVPVESNKALIRRFIEEVHNKGNFALFNELFAPNYVNHSAPANQNDRAAREQGIRSYRAAAPGACSTTPCDLAPRPCRPYSHRRRPRKSCCCTRPRQRICRCRGGRKRAGETAAVLLSTVIVNATLLSRGSANGGAA